MKGDRVQIGLNIENDRLTAVAAVVKARRVEVTGWISVDRPSDIDGSDVGALGRWVGDELRKAGLHRAAKAGVVFAVPRGEVVLKRIALPPGTAAIDLPGMVRLQMVRQLTVSPENAAIDFVPIGHGVGISEASGQGVLAGALQGDRLDWRRAITRAAGGRLRRVGLRSAGAAALLAEASHRRGGATLGIALGSGSTEFLVVEEGRLVFARATDLFRPDRVEDIDSFAQKVAVEAKRTWMSYRASPESTEIEAVAVLGVDETARQVAERCREALALPGEATDYPEYVSVPSEMTPAERSVMAPLVGLLAEDVIGRETLNFANPRKTPDLAARKRQLILLGVLAAILGCGGLYTAANVSLVRKQSEVQKLQDAFDGLAADHASYVRARARVEHLEQWMGSRIDWLGHVDELVSHMPAATDGLLDRLDGRGEIAVGFELPRNSKKFVDGRWTTSVEAVFNLAGTVKRREIADALRELLVKDSEYRVQSKGPDTPQRFDWTLTTTNRRPQRSVSPSSSSQPRAGTVHSDHGGGA